MFAAGRIFQHKTQQKNITRCAVLVFRPFTVLDSCKCPWWIHWLEVLIIQYTPFYWETVNVLLIVVERQLTCWTLYHIHPPLSGPGRLALVWHYQLWLLPFAVILVQHSKDLVFQLCKPWSPHSLNWTVSHFLSKERHQHLSAGLQGSFKWRWARDA